MVATTMMSLSLEAAAAARRKEWIRQLDGKIRHDDWPRRTKDSRGRDW
jgi:hypothetical protein